MHIRVTHWGVGYGEKWPEKLRMYAPTKENLAEPYLSINQHSSASISTNQKPSASISINQHQLASMSISQHQPVSVSIYQHINQHINQHSASINICNWIWNYIYWHKCWAWGGYREILRSVRRLCEKVVGGRLQELLSELTNATTETRRQWWEVH